MYIKAGVKLAGIRPEMVIAMYVADTVFQKLFGEELVLTEATGGVHGRGSLHYVGQAIDIRTRDLTKNDIAKLALEIRERLGEEYDVVIESDHIHIEFQPK